MGITFFFNLLDYMNFPVKQCSLQRVLQYKYHVLTRGFLILFLISSSYFSLSRTKRTDRVLVSHDHNKLLINYGAANT